MFPHLRVHLEMHSKFYRVNWLSLLLCMLPHLAELPLSMTLVENASESDTPLGVEWVSLGTGEQPLHQSPVYRRSRDERREGQSSTTILTQ
jgi:hypothetical protein